MYNISEGHSATKGNELGIFEGIGDVYAQEDLNLFFSNLYSYVIFNHISSSWLDFGLTCPAGKSPRAHTQLSSQLMVARLLQTFPMLGLSPIWTSKSLTRLSGHRTPSFSKAMICITKTIIPSMASSTRFWTPSMARTAVPSRLWTLHTPIRQTGATRAPCNVACTTHPRSSRFPMAPPRRISPFPISGDNVPNL